MKKKGMKCPALAAARALFLPDREISLGFLLVVRIADGGPTAKPPAVVVRPLHCWSRERNMRSRSPSPRRQRSRSPPPRRRSRSRDRRDPPQGAGAATGAEAATEIGVAGAPTAGGTTAEGATGGGVATTARITERTAGTKVEDREVAVDAAEDTAEDTTGRAGGSRGRRVGRRGMGPIRRPRGRGVARQSCGLR